MKTFNADDSVPLHVANYVILVNKCIWIFVSMLLMDAWVWTPTLRVDYRLNTSTLLVKDMKNLFCLVFLLYFTLLLDSDTIL